MAEASDSTAEEIRSMLLIQEERLEDERIAIEKAQDMLTRAESLVDRAKLLATNPRESWAKSDERKKAVVTQRWLWLIAFLFGLAAVFVYNASWLSNEFLTAGIRQSAAVACGSISVALATAGYTTFVNAESAYRNQWIGRLKASADQAFRDVRDPGDLMGLIDANRKQMSTYDQIARSQASSSHRATAWAMVAGLLLIIFGVVSALLGSDSATKYAVAIVTATSVATSGYIASTFIKIQSGAQDQMKLFFREPLVQSYLLTAERLIKQMPGAPEDNVDQHRALISATLAQATNVNQQGLQLAIDSGQVDPPVEPESQTSSPG